jgi:hypothetical protein
MSSNLPPSLGSSPLRRPEWLRAGPSLRAFETRVESEVSPALRDINNLTPSRRIELAGGDTGQQRVAQNQPRFEASVAAADAYGLETQPAKGPLESLVNFIFRPQYAITGALTGLTGQDRAEDDRRFGRVGTATERFFAGLSGEEYRFSEFTNTGRRVAEDEDVGLSQRGWNSALGFLVDTAVDPLTYISFGGSIMGRMRAAQVIRGKSQELLREALAKNTTNVSKMLEEGVVAHNAIRSETLAARMNNVTKRLAEKNDYFKGVEFDVTSDISGLMRRSSDIFAKSGKDIFREVALDTAPEIAAIVYARGGSGALRQWAVKNFGDELGEAYFRALPKDIQGGIRIRMPFARNADGTPIAFGIEGIGAGRLGEKYKSVDQLNKLTQAGRDMVRSTFERPLAALSGKSGAIYYDAVMAAAGKRTIGKASSYVDFENAQYASTRMRQLRTSFDQDILRTHQVASKLYEDSLNAFGKKYQDSFYEYMYNTDALEAAGNSFRKLKEYQKAAYNTAHTWRQMLDRLGHEAVEVFKESGEVMYFLQNYVPRATTPGEIASRQLAGKAGLGKGATPDWSKHRAQWPADWKVDDTGVAQVVRWRPNHDIKKLRAGDFDGVYETDPRLWMGIYLTEMRHALNDRIVMNELIERGFVTAAIREKYRKIDPAETRRRIVELIEEQDPTKRAQRLVPDTLGEIQRVLEGAGDWVGQSTKEAQAKAAALSARLKEQGIDIIGVDEINILLRDETATRTTYYSAMLDPNGNALGSIQQRKNRWQILNPDGSDAFFSGTNTPAIFDDLLEAQEYSAVLFRDARYQSYLKDYLPRQQAELMQEVSDLLTNSDFTMQILRKFDTYDATRQQALLDTWLNALRRFGRDEPKVTVTKSGQPAFLTGPGMQPIDVELNRVTDEFRAWIQNQEYLNIAGIRFEPDGTLTQQSQILVKTKIAQRLGDTYAPVKVMQAMQRMFEVQNNPQTWGSRIYNDYYKPLYAAQKAWMTLGRGPGFVARNILGGTWNNFLADVGAENTLKSARFLAARKAAQRETQDYMRTQGTRLDPLELGEYYRNRVAENLKKKYSGNELEELLDAWDAFSRQGLAGNRETARLYGEVLRSVSGQTGARTPTAVGDVAFGPRGVGTRTQPSRRSAFRIQPDSGTPDAPMIISSAEDLSWADRALEFAAGDNYWIRDVMSPMVEMSEDYMRFAAFLKGVKEVGLEDASTGIRGYTAATWVRTTQFDYADLSPIEQSLKMLVPFYTWTRYNVPLQIRAVIHEPGKIAQALRIHESLGNAFGEDDALEPSYISDRFGFTIGQDSPLFNMLPDWAKPQGDVTLGLSWGEPLGDVNALFRDPFHAGKAGAGNVFRHGLINWREVAQQLNPGINAASEFQRALAESGQEGIRNVEDAPKWARALGFAYEDPTEPGRFLINRSIAESLRQLIPVVGQAERMLPWIVGGDREPGRWTTSIISALFGLPTATTDDWKKASEMNRRSEFVARQLKGEYGADWQPRMEMIRRLTDEGAPIEFIQSLNLRELPTEQVDVMRAVHTWRMLRRIELLMEDGIPEDEILASLSVFVPEGSRAESVIRLLWDYVPKPPGDFERGVRQYGLKPISRQEMKELGLTTQDIKNMTEDEQRSLIYWINRNRGWIGPLN